MNARWPGILLRVTRNVRKKAFTAVKLPGIDYGCRKHENDGELEALGRGKQSLLGVLVLLLPTDSSVSSMAALSKSPDTNHSEGTNPVLCVLCIPGEMMSCTLNEH